MMVDMFHDVAQYALACARDLVATEARIRQGITTRHLAQDISLDHLAMTIAAEIAVVCRSRRYMRAHDGQAMTTAWTTLLRFRLHVRLMLQQDVLSEQQARTLGIVCARTEYALQRLLHAHGHPPMPSWSKTPYALAGGPSRAW